MKYNIGDVVNVKFSCDRHNNTPQCFYYICYSRILGYNSNTDNYLIESSGASNFGWKY